MRKSCIDCMGKTNRGAARCRSCALFAAQRRNVPVLPLEAGNAMVPGHGGRNDDCRHYEACISSFGEVSDSQGRCPSKCRFYSAVPHEFWVQLATRTRGVDFAAYPDNGEL